MEIDERGRARRHRKSGRQVCAVYGQRQRVGVDRSEEFDRVPENRCCELDA
jgi:hypothetical protein